MWDIAVSSIPLTFSVKCPPLTIANGTASPTTEVLNGGTADVTCHSGFVIDGDSPVACNVTGLWDSPPTCIPGNLVFTLLESERFNCGVIVTLSILRLHYSNQSSSFHRDIRAEYG